MPYANKTLSDLRQSLADRHDNGVIPTASSTLAYYDRLLNRGVNYCMDRLRMVKTTSLTTSSGTIALPADFLTIRRVFEGDSELCQVDQEDRPAHIAGTFWISGDHSSGFSLNTTSDTTYNVYYTFKPSEMSATSDECVIPDPEAVVAYAYSQLRRGESDPFEDADTSMAECDARIVEMQSALNVNSNFTGLIMQSEVNNKFIFE